MPFQPDTIARLWTVARAMFARMRDALGDAAAITARGALSDDERRAIRAWLRPLESMVRKIALAEALLLIQCAETRAMPATSGKAPARQPALTLISIPPQARIVRPVAALAARPRAGQRAPSLRLWPRPCANAGPRARALGSNRFVAAVQREHARAAFARRMRMAPRRPEGERLARRIYALVHVLDKPERAAGRLARALAGRPDLALKVALTPAPRTRLYTEPEYEIADAGARDTFYAWRMRPACDTG